VADWISRDKPVPVVHMAAIEAYTAGAVTRRDMRPDDWRRIWPELAGAVPDIATAAAGQET
jgi:DNA-binding transcriptional regulator YdaS (Cro superfamily)